MLLVAEAEHRRAEFWRSEILGSNKWSGLVDTPQLRELLELGVPNAVSADRRDQIDAVFWCEVCTSMWYVCGRCGWGYIVMQYSARAY